MSCGCASCAWLVSERCGLHRASGCRSAQHHAISRCPPAEYTRGILRCVVPLQSIVCFSPARPPHGPHRLHSMLHSSRSSRSGCASHPPTCMRASLSAVACRNAQAKTVNPKSPHADLLPASGVRPARRSARHSSAWRNKRGRGSPPSRAGSWQSCKSPSPCGTSLSRLHSSRVCEAAGLNDPILVEHAIALRAGVLSLASMLTSLTAHTTSPTLSDDKRIEAPW